MEKHLYRPTPNAGLSAALLAAFAQPFAPGQVQLRPSKREQRGHKWVCLAVPFVPQCFYEDRLNALVPGRWSTLTPSMVVACGRFVIAAQVQIDTVIHADYGERPLQSTPALEELGTIAPHAQAAFELAFVGACTRFGMGRYLADLAREWVPYDPKLRRIMLSLQVQATLVLKLYKQANIPLALEKSTTEAASFPGQYPREEDCARKGAARAVHLDEVAAHLRQRDLAWVREHCAGKPLQSILRHYQLQRLESITDSDLTAVINGIHRHQQQHAS